MPGLVYLDNAATSWPKPASVARAVADFLSAPHATPGRGGHRPALDAGAILDRTRRRLADMTGAEPHRVILTSGATESLNIAIGGTIGALNAGRGNRPIRIVTTVLEHNAIRRGLTGWTDVLGAEVEIDAVGCDSAGFVSSGDILDRARGADAVIMTSASNVTGAIQPVAEIGRALRAQGARALLIIDAAQTAGLLDLNLERDGIDALAFSGHKALLGPSGTGALCLSARAAAQLAPVRFGGTGSESAGAEMPATSPTRFEPGTPNTSGFAGLLAAIEDDSLPPPPERLAREREHARALLCALAALPVRILGIESPGAEDLSQRLPIISFTARGWDPHELAAALDASFGIAARAGLHCAPGAHEAFGALATGGAVRLSPGAFTTADDIETCAAALRQLLA